MQVPRISSNRRIELREQYQVSGNGVDQSWEVLPGDPGTLVLRFLHPQMRDSVVAQLRNLVETYPRKRVTVILTGVTRCGSGFFGNLDKLARRGVRVYLHDAGPEVRAYRWYKMYFAPGNGTYVDPGLEAARLPS